MQMSFRSILANLPFAALIAALAVFVSPASTARAEIAAYLVFDAKSGKIYDQKNAMRPWHPASLTKMMTAYVTFTALRDGKLKPTSPVYYSNNARSEPPSKMGFKVGTILTVDNALKMMIVKSANDVSVALGETVSGSEAAFVAEMNRHARRLGMNSTRFTNPNGLPDRAQITNARDFGVLAVALHRDFPQYAGYFRIGGIKLGKRVLRSHNIMLRHYAGADGMKTGYICDSGLNLVASARRGGRRVIAVVMGARSGYERGAVTRVLLDRGFSRVGGSGATLRSLRPSRSWAALPPKGYCRNGKRPSVNELLALYGRKPVTAANVSSGGRIYDDNGRVRAALPGVQTQSLVIDIEPKKQAEKTKKSKRGKKKKGMPPHEILARLIGPERTVSIIPVHTGGADAARAVANLKPIDGIKVTRRNFRKAVPDTHPGRVAGTGGTSTAALAIQPVSRQSEEAAAASLFARANSDKATGRPAILLPKAAAPEPPRKIGGIPVPRPRPNI